MMSASLIESLLVLAAASSASIIVIALLRKPMRIAVGARAAYWLWLLVPATVMGTLPPPPAQSLLAQSYSYSSYVTAALSSFTTATMPASSIPYASAGFAIWIIGAGVMFALLAIRQQRFTRSLGKMTRDSTELWRSRAALAPMLVGALRARLVVPMDFETRYGAAEQPLILAHEKAHLARRDIWVNAFAASWLCAFWFNPLVYWAISRLRMDQELACDAMVLENSPSAVRIYANALLKTQLATESVWRMPVGCHWQSVHPLKERVAMLKQPLPGFSRRFGGTVCALAVAVLGGSAVRAALPDAVDSNSLVLLHMKLTVTSPPNNIFSEETEILIKPGEAAFYPPGQPFDTRCTPLLPNKKALPNNSLPAGTPAPADGQILLSCRISNDSKIVSSPAVIVADGKPAMIEVDDVNGNHHYKLELNASVSKEKIAAARAEAAKRCQKDQQSC
jgi:beta-lactamase regulating signal transducer with metallopeptidase domain